MAKITLLFVQFWPIYDVIQQQRYSENIISTLFLDTSTLFTNDRKDSWAVIQFCLVAPETGEESAQPWVTLQTAGCWTAARVQAFVH